MRFSAFSDCEDKLTGIKMLTLKKNSFTMKLLLCVGVFFVIIVVFSCFCPKSITG